MTLKQWKSRALAEWMRVSGGSRHEAEMFFDHASDILRAMHDDGVAPLDAVKQLMFDDEGV